VGETLKKEIKHPDKIVETASYSAGVLITCTCHLAKIEDFGSFDAVYAGFFPGLKPARTTVQSVLGGGIKVEIDAIARVPVSE
jgi:2-iminobutanoate/2-iminopropanoate deaminase